MAFDYLIFALPFDALKKILPDTSASSSLRNMLDQFETSPITGIHLWFDRQITDLEHAVLLDRTIQWMFHKSKLLGRNGNGGGSYIEVVVSSSKDLVEKSKTEIVELTLKEL
jgi:zeta-carotene desaturase